ncbi:hypothetical protein KCU92_g144, partial [Aureobasidium melanogenum]
MGPSISSEQLCVVRQTKLDIFSDPEVSQHLAIDESTRSDVQDDSSMQGNMAAASWLHTNSLPNIEPSTASFMISDECSLLRASQFIPAYFSTEATQINSNFPRGATVMHREGILKMLDKDR